MDSFKIKSLVRESWSVSWPMTLIMFCVFFIGLTDVYVAGKLGKDIQASYGVAAQLYFIFTIVASALSIGSVSLISRLFTAGKTDDFNRAIDSSIGIAVIGGVVFSLLGFAFAKQIVHSLNIPDQLKDVTVSLVRIFSSGLLFTYFFLNSNAILRASGMVRKSLLTMVAVCGLNVLLNISLGLMSPLKFKGIATATVISSFVGCFLNLFYIRKLTKVFFKFSLDSVKQIFVIGWPAGLLQVLWQVGYMLLYIILSALPTNRVEILAAFTNGLKIESAIFLPAFAFNMANAVVVGNLLGKKNKQDAYSAGLVTGLVGVAIVIILSVGTLLNARAIANFLSNNDLVVKESIRYIYISMLCEPFMAWGVILAGALNGAGDTKSVMLVVATSMWLGRLPLCYILGVHFGLGVTAVWWSMNVSILVQMFFISRRYFSLKWLL
jgi:multidrug resistance protein, MATE family